MNKDVHIQMNDDSVRMVYTDPSGKIFFKQITMSGFFPKGIYTLLTSLIRTIREKGNHNVYSDTDRTMDGAVHGIKFYESGE